MLPHVSDPPRQHDIRDVYRAAVIRDGALTLTQRAVGVICAEEADAQGRIECAVAELAERWGVRRSSFADHLGALVQAKWLERMAIPGKASAYSLAIPNSELVVSRETNSNSYSDVSRETNSNANSNGVVIPMRSSYTVKAAMEKLGIDDATAVRYVAYLKSLGVRSPLSFIRSGNTSIRDLRGHLEDMLSAAIPHAQHVSIPRQESTPCPHHPDYIGGHTADGTPRCPLCRNRSKKGTGL